MKFPVKKAGNILMAFMLLIQLIMSPIKVLAEEPLRSKFNYGNENTSVEYYRKVSEPYYAALLKEYGEKSYKGANIPEILVEPADIVLPEGKELKLESKLGVSDYPAFKWLCDIPWAEWNFEISSEGLYEIELEYYMLPGTGNPATRSLKMDGIIPFFEASNIVFYRGWKDESEPIVNSIGDEVRPSQVEIPGWRVMGLCDAQGYYSQPFRFYLKPGKHTLRMEYVDQDMAIGRMRVRPVKELPAYEQVKKEYKNKGYANIDETVETVELQAESTATEKSDPTIRRERNGDPVCKPESSLYRKLNVLGGYRWRKGNQSITWEFDAPQDGLYKIAVRALQSWNDGLPSYRQIDIDGEIPFKELEEYKFVSNRKWRTEVLDDEKGEPFLFYLTKGTHTISMTVKMGALTPIILSLNDDVILLSNLIRDITKVTGSNPDPNYDYDFFRTIPHLKGNMEILMESLQSKYDMLEDISEKLPAMANNLMTIKSQLAGMVKDPFSIARRLNDLNNALSNLGNWYLSLQNQPLMIDYFLVGAPGVDWGNEQSNVFQKIKATLANFIVSFKKDYNNIGSVVKDDVDIKNTINLWVSRGTEWAELIKEMVDEKFTPETGILVNINVFPAGQLHAGSVNALMLAIASGRAPDGALGIDSGSPVEFAIRDAVYDLSKFKDFQEVSKRFLPSVFTPFKYNDGIFALPETMNFIAMIYRKDIISEYGIRLPNTRDELYNNVLPMLYQNGLQFNYPADFSQFIFQHGAEYYLDNGARSGLETPESYRAFKEVTELYTHYGIPVSANFFNRMRTGEMPIGIGDYNLYIQLSVAAPELAGRWGIAPIPGTLRSDGTIDRSNGSITGQAGVILNQSKKKEETWKFLKWWTSTSVQTKFARELEAIIGTEARWNTANLEAFTNLAWKKEDLEVIKEQWQWAKGVPVVLGGYYTGRYLSNAWNSVVISGVPVRDALESAVEEINRELRMKREEHGIFDNQTQGVGK
ncbi:MAG TPA: extracellular solute-binding protein [Clostridiales bacterium]|nr:extracellular solute-binding protein [Clostridiales bacterium]